MHDCTQKKICTSNLVGSYTLLFYKQHFYMQRQAKIKQKLSNNLRLNFCYLKIIRLFHPRYHSKTIGDILKCTRKQVYLLNEIIWLMIMQMRLQVKNRIHRYNINWPRPRHGRRYTRYKICLSIMMVICIKQHLSNIWSSIHDKTKQH